jgi:hypothetical protein
VDQCFTTVWHQQYVLTFWQPAYASLCVIATILTHFLFENQRFKLAMIEKY